MILDDKERVWIFDYQSFGYLIHRGAHVSQVMIGMNVMEILNEDIMFFENDLFEKEIDA